MKNKFFKKMNRSENANAEIKFRKKIDTINKIVEVTLAATVTLGSLACPPLAYVALVALILFVAGAYYDKKHDYSLSHKLYDKANSYMNKYENEQKENAASLGKQFSKTAQSQKENSNQKTNGEKLNFDSETIRVNVAELGKVKVRKSDIQRISSYAGLLFSSKQVREKALKLDNAESFLKPLCKQFKVGK